LSLVLNTSNQIFWLSNTEFVLEALPAKYPEFPKIEEIPIFVPGSHEAIEVVAVGKRIEGRIEITDADGISNWHGNVL
jgi:hypothetical protein